METLRPTPLKKQTSRLIRQIKHVMGSPSIGAEIGVHRGLTSEALLHYFPNLQLLMVDPWKDWSPEDAYYIRRHKISRLDSSACFDETLSRTRRFRDRAVIIRAFSARAARMVNDRELDFVYIDADHSYQSTMEDILAWHDKVRIGGILSGHDYKNTSNCRVKDAVDDFAKDREYVVQTTRGKNWVIIVQ